MKRASHIMPVIHAKNHSIHALSRVLFFSHIIFLYISTLQLQGVLLVLSTRRMKICQWLILPLQKERWENGQIKIHTICICACWARENKKSDRLRAVHSHIIQRASERVSCYLQFNIDDPHRE